MGREVGPRLAKRFARAVLELGGNNAGIVCPSADLDMALRAIAFERKRSRHARSLVERGGVHAHAQRAGQRAHEGDERAVALCVVSRAGAAPGGREGEDRSES